MPTDEIWVKLGQFLGGTTSTQTPENTSMCEAGDSLYFALRQTTNRGNGV